MTTRLSELVVDDVLLDVAMPEISENRGYRLRDVVEDDALGDWLAWALRQPIGFWPDELEQALVAAGREWDRRWGRS